MLLIYCVNLTGYFSELPGQIPGPEALRLKSASSLMVSGVANQVSRAAAWGRAAISAVILSQWDLLLPERTGLLITMTFVGQAPSCLNFSVGTRQTSSLSTILSHGCLPPYTVTVCPKIPCFSTPQTLLSSKCL
jgi:hypothetical protein